MLKLSGKKILQFNAENILSKPGYVFKNNTSYFSTKTYVVATQKNFLSVTVVLSNLIEIVLLSTKTNENIYDFILIQ